MIFAILSYYGITYHDINVLWSENSGTYKRMDEVRMKQIHILVTWEVSIGFVCELVIWLKLSLYWNCAKT